MLGIGTLVDTISRTAENLADGVSETLFEPVIRLGVTGLSRSGKTVFVTSLVANLLDRGRMPQLQAAQQGRILAAFLQPQPNDIVPRFDYETHLAAMTGPEPHWPESTRAISQLRLSLKVAPGGFLSMVQSPRTVHIDIVDYPGEWLLDLPLMSQSFTDWSQASLKTARTPARVDKAQAWLEQLERIDSEAKLDEATAQALAKKFTSYLSDCRTAGFSACAPGRFLLPGDLAGSPALTFTPLPSGTSRRGSLAREFERRFEAYKSQVIKPFFRDHFSRIDRQIVLIDALSAIHAGPQAIDDLRCAMADVLTCFKIGQNGWLSPITGKSVEKILFAATKADHLHHHQHQALTAIMAALVRHAKDKAEYSGAITQALSLASLRATVEELRKHEGAELPCVRGTLQETGKQAALFAGDLPADPNELLEPARGGAAEWLNMDYEVMAFKPAPATLRSGEGPPHIRLDKAAEFLLGDRLR
ncbi:MAG: YcjX family protein [Rhodobacteraceae bacterium]|nr:YcjX family protein [Paracoccaceae bacterium]